MVRVCGVPNIRRSRRVCVCCNSRRAFSRREADLKITDGDLLIHRVGDRQRVA